MKLTASRCQCGACGDYFNSTGAFDEHRRGKPGENRHCLTPDELVTKGMLRNDAGFWITGVREIPHPAL